MGQHGILQAVFLIQKAEAQPDTAVQHKAPQHHNGIQPDEKGHRCRQMPCCKQGCRQTVARRKGPGWDGTRMPRLS